MNEMEMNLQIRINSLLQRVNALFPLFNNAVSPSFPYVTLSKIKRFFQQVHGWNHEPVIPAGFAFSPSTNASTRNGMGAMQNMSAMGAMNAPRGWIHVGTIYTTDTVDNVFVGRPMGSFDGLRAFQEVLYYIENGEREAMARRQARGNFLVLINRE